MQSNPTGADMLRWTVLFLVLAFSMMGVFLVVYNALLACALDALAGRPVSMARGLKKVLVPRVLGTSIAVSIASFLSVLCLFLPALWVVPRLTFVVPAMLDEDQRGWAAWKRSIELVRHNPTGRWGRRGPPVDVGTARRGASD